MNAEIISIGSELLSGKIANTNAQYLSQSLSSLGIEVNQLVSVGDKENDIKKALSGALSRSNVVILTGGLGPTKDDITKDAVCSLLEIDMHIDELSLSKIENYFAKKGEKMAENNIRQARVPQGSVVLKNDVGLAPGCLLKSGNQCIILLPGVPYEMRPMFENSVKPFLRNMTGLNTATKTVNVFGMSESLIAQALDDVISKGKPSVATYAGGGKTDIVVSAQSEDVKEAIREVDITVEEIERRLGDSVFGVDEPTLEHAVVSELVSRNLTLATAESCTGGLIAKKITDIAGASLCFGLGITSYSEGAKASALGVDKQTLKEFGAVSAETACQMAVGARKSANADIGVSVTGYAGPSTGLGESVGLVFIAVCDKETVWVKRFELAPHGKESREQIRERASLNALEMVRRVIKGISIFNSQRVPVGEVYGGTPIDFNENEKKTDSPNLMFRSEKIDEVSDEPKEAPVVFENNFAGKLKKFIWNLLPNKRDDRVEKVRKSVFIAASLALIISVSYILSYFGAIKQNENLYNDLSDLRGQAPTTSIDSPEEYVDEFAALYERNKDFVGWVEIEGTPLNYPVVKGKDNDYYLTHNFDGKRERHGTPFMDYRNDIDRLNANTVLHGHNMKSDNQMFSELENYYKGKNAINYYRQHPVIKFDTLNAKMEWKIFAVFACGVNTKDEDFLAYYDYLMASSEEDYMKWVEEFKSRSIYDIPVDVQVGDNLLTLSTCYYEKEDQRLVVVARRVRDGESSEVDVNAVTKNPDPKPLYTESKQEDTSSDFDYNDILNNSSQYRPSYNNSSKPSSTYDESYWQTDDTSKPSSNISDNTSSDTQSDTTTSSEPGAPTSSKPEPETPTSSEPELETPVSSEPEAPTSSEPETPISSEPEASAPTE